jgi:uncharacterized protein YidB (DUF937 family)
LPQTATSLIRAIPGAIGDIGDEGRRTMGLLDVLNGMANGPRGVPDFRDADSGGMSKSTMAVLAFLAYKAYRSWTGQQAPPGRLPANRYDQLEERDQAPGRSSGGWLADAIRDVLSGGRQGTDVLHRGLTNTVDDFDRAGHRDIAQSWLGRGPNREISREQLEGALGDSAISELTRQTGLSRDDLISTLQQHLPNAIDELSPEGRLPGIDDAAQQWRRGN